MNKLLAGLLLASSLLHAQSKPDLDRRFTVFLNFRGSLSNAVQIGDTSLSILKGGKPEFTLYRGEYAVFNLLQKQADIAAQQAFYAWKGTRRLNAWQIDSLNKRYQLPATVATAGAKPLSGIRIAIDPGHIAGDMAMARLEQKFLDFAPGSANTLKDTVHIAEGILTYNTAYILRKKLEEQGATVFVTRPGQGLTAFGISYADWLLRKKRATLDSLVTAGALTQAKRNKLMTLKDQAFFWEFFRDFELLERARLINLFRPDLSVVIHYNVDEKNTDWLRPSNKNYTMSFIGGAMSEGSLDKPANKLHLLRLMLSDQLDRSLVLSGLTIGQFSKKMNIPIATQNDADYLRDNCMKTAMPGVFSRNLLLCRVINSPLVYGECLYQDDLQECQALSKNDCKIYGLDVPKRIADAADSYFNAIVEYLTMH